MARQALIAPPGGLRLAWCAGVCTISPLALARLRCALGHQRVGTVLTRCQLPWPVSLLADAQHSPCLTDRVSLPTLVRGRVLWHLGYREANRAAACPASYGDLPRAALQGEPSYRVRGALTEGFDRTTQSMRPLLPGARLGSACAMHSTHSRAPGWAWRLQDARVCAHSAPPACTGVASAQAGGVSRWASGSGIVPTLSRPPGELTMAHVSAPGARPNRLAGIRGAPPPGCRPAVPSSSRPTLLWTGSSWPCRASTIAVGVQRCGFLAWRTSRT